MKRRAAFPLLVALLLGTQGRGRGDAPLHIVEPAAGQSATGLTVVRAEVDPSVAADVRSVRIDVGGRTICVRDEPPFACEWDFGPQERTQVVRAVAALRDGRRLATSMRTASAPRRSGLVVGVDVELVQVTATVVDRQGRFVRGLGRDAFRVLEDGVPQPVAHLIGEGTAREIVVAVDMSGSMGSAMGDLRGAVRGFLAALRPDDHISLVAFNDTVYTVSGRDAAAPARLRAVDRLAPWGGTALYDSVLHGMDVLSRRKGRKALVVFSDGDDQSSAASLADVRRRAETSDAPVYTIGQGRAVHEKRLRGVLEQMSANSGGRSFHAARASDLGEAFAQIADELAHQYLLAYDPTNATRDGSWRRITVEVPGQAYRVRARQGYRAIPRER